MKNHVRRFFTRRLPSLPARWSPAFALSRFGVAGSGLSRFGAARSGFALSRFGAARSSSFGRGP
jgi:hypothetical protein